MISNGSKSPHPYNMGASHPLTGSDRRFTDLALSANIDHLAFSGPGFKLPEAREIFQQVYPGSELAPHGRHGYRSLLVCPLTQAQLLWDDSAGNDRYTLELHGEACRHLGTCPEILSPWRALFPTMTNVPRIDLALDIIGPLPNALPDLIESHRTGCISPPLRGSVTDDFDGVTNQLVGHTYYLGAKSSDKRVRFYDKGQETGDMAAGTWHRWEAQFRNKVAVQVLNLLLTDSSETNIRNLAAGVVETVGGPFEETYKLLATEPLRISRQIPQRSVGKSLEHLHKQLQVVVEAARIIGVDPHSILDHFDLLDPLETSRNPRRAKLARELSVAYTLDTE